MFIYSWRKDSRNRVQSRIAARHARQLGSRPSVHGRQTDPDASHHLKGNPRGKPEGGHEAHPRFGRSLQTSERPTS